MHGKAKKAVLILSALAVLVTAGLIAKHVCEKREMTREQEREQARELTQRLLDEEIYRLDTYGISDSQESIYVNYMVCEPVDDKAQLVEKLERLLVEKRVVENAKDFCLGLPEDGSQYDEYRISIDFYRPSKQFPIGWLPMGNYTLEDYEDIIKNRVISIDIPWDSESVDDHRYKFWKPDTRYDYDTMTFDVYTRQTQADGSFVLTEVLHQ